MPQTRRTILAAAAGAFLACAGSCNILGPAGYFIHGPEKTPARYTLPADRPAVVFVDDLDSRLPSRVVRQRIGKAAERELLDNKCVPNSEIISSDAALATAASERFGKQLGIAQLGQRVGAEVVIYARVESFSLTPNGQEFAPSSRMRVKVVDAKDGKRLWPSPESADPGAEWYTVVYDMPTRQGTMPTALAEIQQGEHELADETGRALARVFFQHETRTRRTRVGD